jgi:ATP-dependent 26S proteasome regulatory subunit
MPSSHKCLKPFQETKQCCASSRILEIFFRQYKTVFEIKPRGEYNGLLQESINTGIIPVLFKFSLWLDGKMDGKSDTVRIAETFGNTESPIVIFHQLTSKLIAMLSDKRVIKEIAASLVRTNETQLETAAYRKIELLQRLKNQLSVDLGEVKYTLFHAIWDDTFNQVLNEIEDITTLIRTKPDTTTRAQEFFCKIKDTFLPSASLNETARAFDSFKLLTTSLHERLMSRNFVRSLAVAVIEDRAPSSVEEARKLYENMLDHFKWLRMELDFDFSSTTEKLSFDILKRQVPTFNLTIIPKQPAISSLSQESPQKNNNDTPTSPFTNKVSLETHFRAHCIAGIPKGINEVVLPVAAAYSSEYAPLIQQLGIVPERGMILYGPPGTGKTVMAQAIASYFGCPDKNIIITSGSNLLDKWVGSTEAGIRDLFKPARKNCDQLYVIIIDEIDAILSTRQSAKNSWERTQVTQFLTELDGVRSSKNVFVIGITNFIEHLDGAAIRPGRLGSLIEVPLPDAQQRAQIFKLHLSFIAQSRLAKSYGDLSEELSQLTEGFSGADIRATVQRAANLVFMETIRSNHFIQNAIIPESGKSITIQDFNAVIEFIFKQKANSKPSNQCG